MSSFKDFVAKRRAGALPGAAPPRAAPPPRPAPTPPAPRPVAPPPQTAPPAQRKAANDTFASKMVPGLVAAMQVLAQDPDALVASLAGSGVHLDDNARRGMICW